MMVNRDDALLIALRAAVVRCRSLIDQLDRLVVESLHPVGANQYARPASPTQTPR